MKNSTLDKTFTIRQALRTLKWVLFAFALIYVGLVFRHAWHNKMGGAYFSQSPFLAAVPENCKKQLGATRGVGSGLVDELLLRPRTWVGPINSLLDYSAGCAGWTIVGGIHGNSGSETNSDSNYREIYRNERGETVVTVTVEFDKPYRERTKP